MFRSDFLAGLITSGAAFYAAPSPAPTVNPLERCDRNYVLPYDQPLEFKHRALDAPDVDLQAYRGNVVLLNFFATWCGPCQMEAPYLVDAANTYYERGLRIVGITSEEQDDAVRKYREKYHLVYPIVVDEGHGLLARVMNNDDITNVEFPVSLFLNERGELTCYRKGAMSQDEVVYKVERMLSFLSS